MSGHQVEALKVESGVELKVRRSDGEVVGVRPYTEVTPIFKGGGKPSMVNGVKFTTNWMTVFGPKPSDEGPPADRN